MQRRLFLQSLAGASASLVSATPTQALTRTIKEGKQEPAKSGKATACILLWMGGGMCHLDTLDPKRLGDAASGKAGSAYKAIPTAIQGVKFCEHLPRVAERLDRGVVIRSLNHSLFVDHADSSNLMKTGRTTSGTIVYPSLGSQVSHELGPSTKGIPPYVLIGYPNLTNGPGFLGSQYSYVYLTDTAAGPTGLKPPRDVSNSRLDRRVELLDKFRNSYSRRNPQDKKINSYNESISNAIRLTKGDFPRVFKLDGEPAKLRNRYGSEFGQRCLLARRLVASGVRFVEVSYNLNFVNGTGWDTHRHGQEKQHLLIKDLDRSLGTLLDDLSAHKMLDSTLVILASEFGRPAKFDNGKGRGHQSSVFSVALFGGGLKSGQVIGASDELAKEPIEDPVSVPDFHATIHTALGINPQKELFDGDRPVPITNHGKTLQKLFS